MRNVQVLASRAAATTARVTARDVAQRVPHIAVNSFVAVARPLGAYTRHPAASSIVHSTQHSITTRGFSSTSGAEPDVEAGLRALEKARVCIDADDIAEAMKYLNIAAHHDIADAQYLLGSLLEKDDDDEDNDSTLGRSSTENELLLDAETRRQRAADDDEPEDLRSIRKRARQSYKEYLLAKRTLQSHDSTAVDGSGGRLAARIVQRASKEELDRAFGVTLVQLLDPTTKLRPLSSVAHEEQERAEQLSGDATQAVEWLRRAAANGHRDAHVYLGNLCLEHEPPLVPSALEWYFRVSPPKLEKDPHPDALFNIGMVLFEGVEHAEPPFPANRAAAIPYFVRAAEEGDASAQFFMGQLLHSGDEELGIEPNATSALMLIERAAANEHSGAQFYLAQLYRSGDEENGIHADCDKFLEYLDMAMEGGDEDALFCMADIYLHGSDGFEQDLDQARMFYHAAGEAGSADAYCCLGALYHNGTGVEQDFEKAFVFYQAAADRHSMEAWKNLADMYFNGRGVPQSTATAESILKMLKKMEAEQGDADDQ